MDDSTKTPLPSNLNTEDPFVRYAHSMYLHTLALWAEETRKRIEAEKALEQQTQPAASSISNVPQGGDVEGETNESSSSQADPSPSSGSQT